MIIFIIHVMGLSEHLLILIVHLILCNNYILIIFAFQIKIIFLSPGH